MEKIIITGSSGLIGSRFVELYSDPNQLLTPSEEEFNLLNSDTISNYLSAHPVSTIVNFGAYTDVSRAEDQRNDKSGLCWSLNVDGLKNIIAGIGSSKIHLIQISTDMVFSGLKSDPGPYPENHLPESNSKKLTWYGYTKAKGEALLPKSSAIVRICNPVRSHFSGKLDYFRKPLSLFDQGKLYPLFSDQNITISYVDEIVAALEIIIKKQLSGVFHVSSPDITSPHAAISLLINKTRGDGGVVQSSSVTSMGNPVRYPQHGGLKCTVTEKKLGLKFSPVSTIIDKLITQGL